jgi:hypothetical protein
MICTFLVAIARLVVIAHPNVSVLSKARDFGIVQSGITFLRFYHSYNGSVNCFKPLVSRAVPKAKPFNGWLRGSVLVWHLLPLSPSPFVYSFLTQSHAGRPTYSSQFPLPAGGI